MSTAEKRRYTVAEYLAFERASDTKHEYYQGEIFAMVGASQAHNFIAGNLYTAFKINLRGRCHVYMGDMRVQVDATGLYTYPDIAVACPKSQFEDEVADTLLNPRLIVEVLSESPDVYDRGQKFGHYQRIDSLAEYVLISQNDYRVEIYTREDGSWSYVNLSGRDESVHFRSVDLSISFEELYSEVEIPNSPQETSND